MILVISGLPGAGKSLKLGRIIRGLLYRNKAWHEAPDNPNREKRIVLTNLKLSPSVLKEWEGWIEEWTDTAQLTKRRNVDVVWDEMAANLDATQWQNMSLELKRWLQQHRKFGVEIYGTAQDFSQVDKSARRVVSDLLHVTKLIGSPDKSATKPPIKRIWGLCMIKTLDPQQYDEAKSKFEPMGIPQLMWITREDVDFYDTTAEVAVGKYPPLRHIDRVCELKGCDHHKVLHV